MVIKIFGSRLEGKSSIAELLAQTLKDQGFEVIVEDESPNPKKLSLKERLDIMSDPQDPLQCTIKTIQYGRESRPQYAVNFEKQKSN